MCCMLLQLLYGSLCYQYVYYYYHINNITRTTRASKFAEELD